MKQKTITQQFASTICYHMIEAKTRQRSSDVAAKDLLSRRIKMNGWQVVFARTLAAALFLLVTAGAAQEVSPQAASSLEQVRTDAARIKEHASRTAAAARKLARSRSYNVAESLDGFSSSLGGLKSTLASGRAAVTATEDQTSAYFAKWDEQLRGMSEQLQKSGQKRQAEVKRSFSTLRTELGDVRESLKPFVDEMSEMEQYLRMDQTKAALNTISSRLRSAADREHVIRRDLDKLIQQIDAIQRKR